MTVGIFLKIYRRVLCYLNYLILDIYEYILDPDGKGMGKEF
jgi:hypothetical protein